MMAKVLTASLFGISGRMITVEVDITKGFPAYNVVGLAGTSVREAGYRVRSALYNTGYSYPTGRITINLAPAEMRKEGGHFDLPMALGVLLAMGEISMGTTGQIAVFGQLSLDGNLVPIQGALPLVLAAGNKGVKKIIVPAANAKEVSLIEDIEIYPVETLAQLIRMLKGEEAWVQYTDRKTKDDMAKLDELDYGDVAGQEAAKRALIICAAGSHGLMMTGSPGVGKTMLARRLPSILPPMTKEEVLDVSKIYSVSGLLSEEKPVIYTRPFRSPHHTITMPALLGGGHSPKPGELSLAHRGVLFLDELSQFDKGTLDGLRQPLEEGQVTIARQGGAVTFPGEVIFLAATNPCRCGFAEDPTIPCTCTQGEISRYQAHLSKPMMNRIDLHIKLYRTAINENKGKGSREMRDMVLTARKRQLERYKDEKVYTNGQLSSKLIEKYCPLDKEAQEMLNLAYERLSLSMRTCHKTIKVARTIADVDGDKDIGGAHIAEALQYRRGR